jgi:hypothetical protein
VNHGFGRTNTGQILKFNVPGAGTGNGQGTSGLSLNDSSVVTGYYADSGTVYHGYMLVR